MAAATTAVVAEHKLVRCFEARVEVEKGERAGTDAAAAALGRQVRVLGGEAWTFQLVEAAGSDRRGSGAAHILCRVRLARPMRLRTLLEQQPLGAGRYTPLNSRRFSDPREFYLDRPRQEAVGDAKQQAATQH